MLKEKIEVVRNEALAAFGKAEDTRALYDLKVQFLGKQGQFSSIMKEMGKLSAEEKPAFGKLVNEVKTALEVAYQERENELKSKELDERLLNETLDLTLPGPTLPLGAQHPIAHVMDEISGILSRIGYSVRLGPLIEKDWYNFEALNFPPDHPARDMQDTFFIDPQHVLRTHTSPIQIRAMENEKPPFRIIGVGPVFRADSDISHSPNFHQIEGFVIEEKVSMADLKGHVAFFVREYFGKDIKTRFRPSFFPFTEPSAEVDCSCPLCLGKGCRMCSGSGWIEIGGCGLMHPNLFSNTKMKYPQWQGFAFGFGLERMAVIKYGIDHIGLFFDNDVRFLRQFAL